MVTQAATVCTTMPFGFAATNPAGQVKTTFIGGDGQKNFNEPNSTINGVGVTRRIGTAPIRRCPGYSSGQSLGHRYLQHRHDGSSREHGAAIKVAGGPDCLVWVAQVLSIGHERCRGYRRRQAARRLGSQRL